MIRQYITKKRKVLNGLIRTYRNRADGPYSPARWFDRFYEGGVSDHQTIATDREATLAQYHYASVKLLITRYLVNHEIMVKDASVFDIGSGAGHWLNFYKILGAKRCTGIDVSEGPAKYLREKYSDDNSVEINKGLFQDFLEKTPEKYDLINAIGVIFHVVDDAEWARGLAAVADTLKPGGHLIVGGHFGFLNNVNVQFDSENKYNKRLRSKNVWKKTLISLGFKQCTFIRNNAYLSINGSLPENNILVATR